MQRLILVLALLLRELLRGTCSECVRWNICHANASGAMNTARAHSPIVGRVEIATRTDEERQAHVRDDELAEHATVHLAEDLTDRWPGSDRCHSGDQIAFTA